MLQLGLLKGCNVAWFTVTKQRIKAQSIFVPTRSSWYSSILNSVNRVFRSCLNLFSDIPVIVQILTIYFEQAVIFIRVCRTSFFWFIIPNFCLTVSVFEITVSGMPQFFSLSLLCRFRLSGLFLSRDNDCLGNGEPSPSFDSKGKKILMSFVILRNESLRLNAHLN